jgi:DNA-binding transcriptional LysR family regulator
MRAAMQIPSLKYFLAVVDTGSIRQAAERLNVSGSAISRQIQNLEHLFGAVFFDRRQSGMVLTDEGRALELHIRRAARELDLAGAEIDNIRGLVSGKISFVTIEGVVHSWVFPAIAEFQKTYPGVSFDCRILGTETILDAVSQDRTDFGIAIDPEQRPEIEIIDAIDTRFVAAMSPRHPLASSASVDLHDLHAHELVMLDRSFMTSIHLYRSGEALGLSFEPTFELNQIEALISFVMLTGGLTVLPSYAVSPAALTFGIAVAEISKEALPERQTAVFVNRNRRQTIATKTFFEYLSRKSPRASRTASPRSRTRRRGAR